MYPVEIPKYGLLAGALQFPEAKGDLYEVQAIRGPPAGGEQSLYRNGTESGGGGIRSAPAGSLLSGAGASPWLGLGSGLLSPSWLALGMARWLLGPAAVSPCAMGGAPVLWRALLWGTLAALAEGNRRVAQIHRPVVHSHRAGWADKDK